MFIADVREHVFLEDLMLRSAVQRQFEVLGEALNRLRRDDPVTGERVPDLDKIIGMRNVIAHEYGDVDDELVWAAATGRIPGVIAVLGALLEEIGPAPGVPES